MNIPKKAMLLWLFFVTNFDKNYEVSPYCKGIQHFIKQKIFWVYVVRTEIAEREQIIGL